MCLSDGMHFLPAGAVEVQPGQGGLSSARAYKQFQGSLLAQQLQGACGNAPTASKRHGLLAATAERQDVGDFLAVCIRIKHETRVAQPAS